MIAFLIRNLPILATIAAVGVFYGISYQHGYSTGKRVVQTQWDDSIKAAQSEAMKKSAELEKELAALRIENQKTNVKVRKVINENPSYATCRMSPDSVRVINEAIGKP